MNKIRVSINEANISTSEIPVIGTDSLCSCVGVLIYSKKHKKSIVIHTSTDWKEPVIQSLILLAENEMVSFENINKVIECQQLHEKYDLYDFEPKIKKEILTKAGVNITQVEDTLEVTVIPGYYPDHYNVAINLIKFFSSLSPLFDVRTESLPKNAVRTVMFDDVGSHEFYFNSNTGKFVTEQVKDKINPQRYRL